MMNKEAKPKTLSSDIKDDRLELLFTIINRSKADYYLDLLQGFEINMQLIVLGRGTADEKTLKLLGFSDSNKAVIISVIKAKYIKDILSTLGRKFKTIRNGKGIAYTVPLNSIIGKLLYGFLSNNRMIIENKEEAK